MERSMIDLAPWFSFKEFAHTSKPGARSNVALINVVSQFDVATAKRYRWEPGKTYCNVFARDVMAAMGCPLPELLANDIYDWLAGQSEWRKVDADGAKVAADFGHPVLAVKKGEPHGHVAVLMPSMGKAGLWIAQAGKDNLAYAGIRRGFGPAMPEFWRHE